MKKKNVQALLGIMCCSTIISSSLFTCPALATTNNNKILLESGEESLLKNDEININYLNRIGESSEIEKSGISIMKVDGEIYQKEYKQATKLYDEDGNDTGVIIFITVIFDVYEDSLGKSITGIESVSSSLTSNGITAKKYKQDPYSKKSFSSSKKQYNVKTEGSLTIQQRNIRCEAEITIKPNYGTRY